MEHLAGPALLLLCLWSVSGAAGAALRKCCGPGHRLTLNLTADGAMACGPAGVEADEGGPLWWVPPPAVAPGVRDLLGPGAGPGAVQAEPPRCPLSARDVLLLSSHRRDFRLVGAAAEVRLEAAKPASLPEEGRPRVRTLPPPSFCVDAGPAGSYAALLCPCDHLPCVRTCCVDGFAFNTSSGACADARDLPDALDWVPEMIGDFDYYRLPAKRPQCEKLTSYVLPKKSNDPQIKLFPNGSVQAAGLLSMLGANTYCGVYSTEGREMLLHCLATPAGGAAWAPLVYGVLFLAGGAALLATVLATALLPPPAARRSMHGRMALAHNTTLMVGYVALGLSQLRGRLMDQQTCAAFSFIIQFSILSAFFWLNVMCIDISWTFSGLRPIQGSLMQRDQKTFIYYSLYAWGSTALISIATVVVEYSPHPSSLKPNFGTQMCFFNNSWAMFVFFYGPMALLLFVNLLLFLYTAFKIFVVRRDTAILNAKDSSINAKNKQKLVMYIKLFGLMGITYITEVISWAVGGDKSWWYLTDTINILRAFFIFIIFCCKRTVYYAFRDKVLQLVGREVPGRNTSTALTRSCQSHTTSSTIAISNT